MLGWFIAGYACGCTARQSSTLETRDDEVIQFAEIRQNDFSSDETIDVAWDPVYKQPKRYRGMSLPGYLNRRGLMRHDTGPDTQVELKCADGYNPIIPLRAVIRDRAFLASGDLDAPSGQNWIPFAEASSRLNPGPFYLVWPESTPEANAWPYGIVAIRVGTTVALLGPALPRSERFRQGFMLFRVNCMVCHSVNGIGGTVSMDLNVPLNVFEYWQADKLQAFVADPEQFRRNGRMPSFDHLGPTAISDMLKYVEHMKQYKSLGTR
jgi:mono/diheme cytochrome c family protein